MQEQRTFKRLEAQWLLTYQTMEDDGSLSEPISMYTINVSESGVCFTTKQPLTPGAPVVLKVESDWLTCTLFALARVVWSRTTNGAVATGAEFVWLGWDTDEVQQAIVRYVEDNL